MKTIDKSFIIERKLNKIIENVQAMKCCGNYYQWHDARFELPVSGTYVLCYSDHKYFILAYHAEKQIWFDEQGIFEMFVEAWTEFPKYMEI